MNLKRGTLVLLGLSMFSYGTVTLAHELNVKGSVPLAKNTPLHSLAKVNLSEAVSTAERDSKGKVVEAFLGHDNGFVTYTVVVASPDQTVTEFCVDAGTGQVLSRRTEKAQKGKDCSHGEDEKSS